jgi:hypothetical protein
VGFTTIFYCLRFETSFLSPPTTRRATVEVFDPATTRLNCFYLCLHFLKTVFRQPSREHLVERFGVSVVTKTTPPLCRKRLSIYALSRERVYNCHLDNDTGNLVTEQLSSNGRPLRFRYSDTLLLETSLLNPCISDA